MFGFDGPELAVIAVVALICIGPKDMPVAIRAITGAIKKMRRMAGEFQGHVDDMLKEADLHEVSDTLRDLRGMNLRGAVTRAVDPDGSIMRGFSDPFADHPVPTVTEQHVPGQPIVGAPLLNAGPPPDFLPPGVRPPVVMAPAPDFMPPRAHPPVSEVSSSQAEDL